MTVDSVLDIYNMALSVAGAPGRVSQVNEDSREREVCERWYESARNTVQEAAYWPSCKTHASLSLLVTRDYSQDWTDGDPPPQYQYKFALPADYLRARALSDYQPFDIVWSEDRRVLVTNSNPALLEYSRRSDIVSNWTPLQQQATAYGLAAHIGPELTGKRANIQRAIEMANEILMQARTQAANATMHSTDTIPDWIAARGYAESAPSTRFFYELGGLFAAGAISA